MDSHDRDAKAVAGEIPTYACVASGAGILEGNQIRRNSRKNRANNLPRDVGQSVLATAVEVGEQRVVEAQQVQDRRVEIVHVDRAFGGGVTNFVGGAVDDTPLRASAREPRRKPLRIVVPTDAVLAARHPSEFAGPNDERLVEQPALFEIG